MKNNIKPLSLFLLLLGTLLILAVYESNAFHAPSPPSTGSAVSAASEEDRLCESISLPAHINIHEYTYNAVNNSLAVIHLSGSTYQLYRLDPEKGWRASSRWKVSGQKHLLHFVYGSDGTLYACLQDTKDTTVRQTFVRLGKNGSLSDVTLHDLDQVPRTALDASMKKKGGHAPHDITDIRFSGTVLAVTYRNYAVKFYNIAEGRALGASSLTGDAAHTLFYQHHYPTSGGPDSSSPLQLRDYDMRTGEPDHTMTLGGTGITASSGFWLANYREKIYLLSENGLFTASLQDTLFMKALRREQFSLPEDAQIRYFQAARDNVLYIAYLDNQAQEHLMRLTLQG